MRKGQLTLEYLMILVILLLIFNGISLDLIASSTSDASLFQSTGIVKAAVITINETVESFFWQAPGASRVVALRAPPDCDIVFNGASITLSCVPGSAGFDVLNGKAITPVVSGQTIAYSCLSCSGPAPPTLPRNQAGWARIARTA